MGRLSLPNPYIKTAYTRVDQQSRLENKSRHTKYKNKTNIRSSLILVFRECSDIIGLGTGRTSYLRKSCTLDLLWESFGGTRHPEVISGNISRLNKKKTKV